MSSELTNPNSRRKRRSNKAEKPVTHSKDYENSQLAAVLGNLSGENESKEDTSDLVADKKDVSPSEDKKVEVESVIEPSEMETNDSQISSTIPDFSNLPKKTIQQDNEEVEIVTPALEQKKAKVKSKQKRSKNGLRLNENDSYALGESTLYNRILTVSRSLSVREDVYDILDAATKTEDGKAIKGYKSDIVSNAIMKELAELGYLDKAEVERELKPYR